MKSGFHLQRFLALTIGIGSISLLNACGQPGPLYLPGTTEPAASNTLKGKTVTPNTPAPPTTSIAK